MIQKNIVVIIALFLVICAVYSNSLHNSFHFDDQQIRDRPNLRIKELSLTSLKQTIYWVPESKRIYRPTSGITLGLNYYFSQMDPYGYHIVNIFIHFLCSISVFWFVLSLLSIPGLQPSFFNRYSYEIAAFTCLLFALHPLQTNVATYIIQRMTSLMTLFFVLSVTCFINFRKSFFLPKKQRKHTFLFFVLAFLTASLAFASKENSATLPLIILLTDLLLFYSVSTETQKKTSRCVYFFIFIIPLSVFLLLWVLPFTDIQTKVYNYVHIILVDNYKTRNFTLFERLLTEPRVVFFYLYQILIPKINLLNLNHDFLISTGFFSPVTTLISFFFVLLIPLTAFLIRKKYNIIAFCILWYFVNLVIESSFISLEIIYEHRTYLPGITVFILLASLLLFLVKQYLRKHISAIILATVLILYGNGTYLRNFTWHNGSTMWEDIVKKSPNLARAHGNYGRYLYDNGQIEKAEKEFRQAIKLDPATYEAYGNLSKLLISYFHKQNEGMAIARQLYRIVPEGNYTGSLVMANMYFHINDYKSAEIYYRKVIKLAGFNTEALNNLGICYLSNDKREKAIHLFQYGLRVDSLFFPFVKNLSLLYWQGGEKKKAINVVKKYLNKSHENIAEAQFILKNYKETTYSPKKDNGKKGNDKQPVTTYKLSPTGSTNGIN